MKLELDTTLKTIKVEDRVNLLELTEALERLLPNGLWKTFTLICNVTITWSNPILVYPYYPYYPWWNNPIITCGGTSTGFSGNTLTNGDVTYTLQAGIYNVEI